MQDTVNCGELWKRCHASAEVRSIQDTHIQARISQFRDNSDGIDVFKCPVVKEYYDSGRADRIDQSTEGACTVSEVSFTPFYLTTSVLPTHGKGANFWKHKISHCFPKTKVGCTGWQCYIEDFFARFRLIKLLCVTLRVPAFLPIFCWFSLLISAKCFHEKSLSLNQQFLLGFCRICAIRKIHSNQARAIIVN